MISILSGATAPITGQPTVNPRANCTVQASVAGTGAVGATVIIEASNNDGADYLTLGTITLSGTTRASDGAVVSAKWDLIRARLTAVSGTGAVVNVSIGL